MEAELRHLQELERWQQVQEQIFAVRARLSRPTTLDDGGSSALPTQQAGAEQGALDQAVHSAQLAANGAQLAAQSACNQAAVAYGAAGLGAATAAATASIPAVAVTPAVTTASALGPGVRPSLGAGGAPSLGLYTPAGPATGPGVQASLGAGGAPSLGQHPLAPYAPYPYAYSLAPPSRIPVRQPPKFEGKNSIEWRNWKRACEDEFRNNPAFFPDEESKVNWSLTHLDSGPRDTVEKYLEARRSRMIT
jgi:hypothetical protein